MADLRMGYFEDFKGKDAILLSGDREGLEELARLLRGLEDPTAAPIDLHILPFMTVHRGLRLTAYPADREAGIRRERGSPHVPAFGWHRSQEGWLEICEKIEAGAEATDGHHWLDVAGRQEDAVVMASKGEYDVGW